MVSILRQSTAAMLGVISLLCMASCASTVSGFVPDAERFSARDAQCTIEIVKKGNEPSRAVNRIGLISVRIEKTHFASPGWADALPDIQRQACLAGADAVVDVEEDRSSYIETRAYLVQGIAARFRPR